MSLTSRRPRAARRDAVKHPLHADILVHVGPVDALTVSDDLEIGALFPPCVGQSPRPGERTAYGATVCEVGDDLHIRDANVEKPRSYNISRNAHSIYGARCLQARL